MGLREYVRKRDFEKTAEPRGAKKPRSKGRSYVIQKHAASRLHYDFRLEHDGVLSSWAVPKGPSLDPNDKRLAVHVEDHPIEYGGFEGTIPAGEYGGGTVMLWDRGTWEPTGDVDLGMRAGKLEFELHGERLKGNWRLVRLGGKRNADEKNWLLVKRTDSAARPGAQHGIVERETKSVKTGRAMDEIAGGKRANTKKAPARKKKTTTRRTPTSSPLTAKLPARARKAPLPDFVEPQLATLQDAAPADAGWIHEIKYDGYRMQARLEGGKTRWISRNGLDWTHRFSALSDEVNALPARTALLDGEVVVLKRDGISDFQELQRVLGEGGGDLTYFAFDLLHLDGLDLRACTQLERKELLRQLLGSASGAVRYSDHVEAHGDLVRSRACRALLEGIVSKRADAPYTSGRTHAWIKTKCGTRQEFVIAGYTAPEGSRVGFGALVLGVYAKQRLVHVGRVGTGFDRKLLTALTKRMRALRRSSPPFDDVTNVPTAGVTWIRPVLVCEVAFTGWTTDGLLRHPVFEGLREDKSPRDVVRERAARRRGTRVPVLSEKRAALPPERPARASTEAGGASIFGVTITHPERVLDKASGTTKLDVARYYERVADRILLHAGNRPLSVIRCPSGFAGPCFFQKHASSGMSADVRAIELGDSKGGSEYMYVSTPAGLMNLVQMNAHEIHPWGCRVDKPERPDRIVMDLDPAPDVRFERVVEAALILRDVLLKLDLVPFLKTTGGKGLHVVLPIVRRYTWDEVREFAHALATSMTAVEPKLYVDVATKARRAGRIFVDYLRNGRGATAVAPYSVRARPHAPIAMPLRWNELDGLRAADTFRVGNVEARWKKLRVDPWSKMDEAARALPAAKSIKSP